MKLPRDKGVIVDALRQLADDFRFTKEQVGMMRDSGKGFWWRCRYDNCNRAKAFTRKLAAQTERF